MVVPLDQYDFGASARRGDRGGGAGGPPPATSTSQLRNIGTRRAASVIVSPGRVRRSESRPAWNTSA
jgi:hypothetical protein